MTKTESKEDTIPKLRRRLPVGAEVTADGGVHFRVWAPQSRFVAVELSPTIKEMERPALVVALEPEENGYFSGGVAEVGPGLLYRYRLEQGAYPDPASRFQPNGPHGPSLLVDPTRFQWTDMGWKGVGMGSQVLYEMHMGTFTGEGSWAAAAEKLPDLADLGVTVLELMPVADFPGRFGWGYDGVNLYAPTRLYGTPDDFRAFVDRAHELGLGVILDVVYNHFGPDGSYLKEFSPHYFTSRYANEWGDAINFDGLESSPVREFFIANAGYWIDEYHMDGLRLDATQQIFDSSPEHILAAIGRQVRKAANGRATYIVAENEPQETRLVRPAGQGGYGLDALWNDDFHHEAMVALTGRSEAYYSDYRATPQEFISAMKWGYLFQGQWYQWQKKRRGTPAFGLAPCQFIHYIQNHDQVANSLRGVRAHGLTSPATLRTMTALLLLGPGSPMLFQGQEFAASTPFLYFADHNPELAKRVAEGRREFLAQFQTIACAEPKMLSSPNSEETFMRCKLNFADRDRNAEIYALHRDLIRLRREDPVLGQPRRGGMDGAVLGPDAFVLRFFGEAGNDRLLLVNLGRDLRIEPAPEPLLAPVEGHRWRTCWSSEDSRYGGCGSPPLDTGASWCLPGQTALVLVPEAALDNSHGENPAQNRADQTAG